MGRRAQTIKVNHPLVQWVFTRMLQQGFNSATFAQATGVTQNSVWKIFAGQTQAKNIKVDTWRKFFAVVGNPPDELNPMNMGGEERL